MTTELISTTPEIIILIFPMSFTIINMCICIHSVITFSSDSSMYRVIKFDTSINNIPDTSASTIVHIH